MKQLYSKVLEIKQLNIENISLNSDPSISVQNSY